MAVRRPLILTGSNDLIEMTDAQRDAVKDRCRYLYGANPSVTLSRVASSGNLGTISDTRKQAGASTTHVSSFRTAAQTPNISTVTVDYARVSSSAANTTASTDTNNIAFPIYYDGSAIKAMSLQDMYDTFIFDAIDTLLSAVGQPGTYRIHTDTTLAGYSAVSTSTVFSDTRANVGAYTAGGIAETNDQPTTITNYYLHGVNQGFGGIPSVTLPAQITSGGDIQSMSASNFGTFMNLNMKYWVGEKVRYNINSTGNNRGSGMVDTKMNGSNYQTRFVNTDDYRAQEFPGGSAITESTSHLRIRRI